MATRPTPTLKHSTAWVDRGNVTLLILLDFSKAPVSFGHGVCGIHIKPMLQVQSCGTHTRGQRWKITAPHLEYWSILCLNGW